MAKTLMQVSHLPIVLLGLSFLFAAIAVGTPHWQGGSLFSSRNLHWEELCSAVGAMMIIGCISIGLAFLLGIYWTIYPDMTGPMLLTFYVTLYLGTIALSIANLVFTAVINKTWSFFIATVGCLLAFLVIWVDLPLLPTVPLPWKRGHAVARV